MVSIGDLEPAVPGLIPSRLDYGGIPIGQGTCPRLLLVCLPRDHEHVNYRRDITEIVRGENGVIPHENQNSKVIAKF